MNGPINIEHYIFNKGVYRFLFSPGTSVAMEIDNLSEEILNFLKHSTKEEIVNFLSNKYSKCDIEMAYSKIEEFYDNKWISKKRKMRKPKNEFDKYTLKLHPTSKCNLKCTYCFKEEMYDGCESREIDLETAKKSIDYFVNEFGKNGSVYNVDLTGSGEPLLRFDFIKEVNEYCKELSKKTGKYIYTGLCTNGTLLTEEKSKYMKENNILYGISIDGGKEVQDSIRQYGNKKGTYEDIVTNCEKIENKQYLGFAVTITGKNTDFKKIYKDLYSLGYAEAISMKPVRSFDESDEYAITDKSIESIKEGYDQLAEYLITEIAEGNIEPTVTILKGADYFGKYIKNILRRDLIAYRCSAGLNSFTVDYKGDMYICPAAINNEKFKMGNVHSGVLAKKVEEISECYADNIDECKSCWARYLCGGECFVVGDMTSGDVKKPYKLMCEYKKHLIELAVWFTFNLKRIKPDLLEEIMKRIT